MRIRFLPAKLPLSNIVLKSNDFFLKSKRTTYDKIGAAIKYANPTTNAKMAKTPAAILNDAPPHGTT